MQIEFQRRLSLIQPMTGYTKLFGSIVGSTIWSEDDQTRIVWITMLAMANQHGEVEASIPGLAKFAKVPIEQTERALQKLKAPDKYSRSKEFEGRRIEDIDGGWLILNHAKYREKASQDDRREQARIRAQRFRQRNVTQSNANVTQSNAKQKQKQKHILSPTEKGVVTQSVTQSNADSEDEAELNKMLAEDAVDQAKERFKAFLNRWWTDYRAFWGRDYIPTRGKDHANAKRFLASASGYTLDELMVVAHRAWEQGKDGRFLTNTLKQASTVTGFCTQFNQLVTELQHERAKRQEGRV